MGHPRAVSGVGEDNVGIPDDLRCKRSDGKQWRCTAMSMPDKTVCEKHYIQAKKRAANSAMRASIKKEKRKSIGDSDIYSESKSDDMDMPLSSQFGEYSGSLRKKKKQKLSKSEIDYSPEMPQMRSFSDRSSLRSAENLDLEGSEYEDTGSSYRTTTPTSSAASDRSGSQKIETSPMMQIDSDGSSETFDGTDAQPCHQCRNNYRDGLLWCLKCNKRGYCENCISMWYSDIPVEEIQRACPACRSICSCRVCMRGDNLIKARIREIPVREKLQYLYSLLSAVAPIVECIHSDQCFEVELERKLQGYEIDLTRARINADEQMCCDFCRTPVIDYHRHCPNCSFDLCLNCCKDIRVASKPFVKEEANQSTRKILDKDNLLSNFQLHSLRKFSDWKTNNDGSIPCPPKEYGGCGSSNLALRRIFKMNWVAKLVKNVEEMVSGCKIVSSNNPKESSLRLRCCKASNRDDVADNFLYHPSLQDLKNEGIVDFRMHWTKGRPVIVKEVCDGSAMTIWDPMSIWRGVKKTTNKPMENASRIVKAVDCRDGTEIDIELEEFMKGYFDGRVNENGQAQLLKLKDWPSPSASEEFLLYQRPDFISKLPLLEFIHSKWGLLNVAAKLPHYSLQVDVGPKIFISYGRLIETNEGYDAADNLHHNMRDMVFLLVHMHEVKANRGQTSKTEKLKSVPQSDVNGSCSDADTHLDNDRLHSLSAAPEYDYSDVDNHEKIANQGTEERNDNEERALSCSEDRCSREATQAGAFWDVFRREDVPKLMEYVSIHQNDFAYPDKIIDDYVSRPLYDRVVYLNKHHKSKLKDEFGVEPWSFEQNIGEAVFIPAGCPFQVQHRQSSVQLGLDFLFPESLGEVFKLFGEIRGLPNDHETKIQIMEVGKISLYAASSAIKEVQKLVLDPKTGPELGFEDPNLTSLVSQNLEKMTKRRQVTWP